MADVANHQRDASKPALATLSDTMHIELQAVGIRVVGLRTGHVNSNFIQAHQQVPGRSHDVPKGSVYEAAGYVARSVLLQERFSGEGSSPSQWAAEIVADLLGKRVPVIVYRGKAVWGMPILQILPTAVVDWILKRKTEFDLVEQILLKKS